MQVPSHVEYERATSVEHALELLARFGPESRVLAGGHSLIPMMKLRLAQPETLIDINGIKGLSRISVQDDELRIGALVRHAQLLSSAVAGEHFPILHDAERVIADPVVRNWGTIGGSLCQADPSEDLSAAFGAIRATAVIHGRDGARFVPVREFHLGPYETVVAPGELLTELRVPIRPGGGSAYEKVARRVGDWSVAAAGTVLWLAPAAGTAADGRPRHGTRAGTAATRTGPDRSKTGTKTRNGAADGLPRRGRGGDRPGRGGRQPFRGHRSRRLPARAPRRQRDVRRGRAHRRGALRPRRRPARPRRLQAASDRRADRACAAAGRRACPRAGGVTWR